MLELRYIGDSYRNKLLSNPILANVEPAIDILFNSNIFEAKLPVKLPLDKNAITITSYKPDWLDSHKNAHLMHNAAKNGDIEQIKKLLAQGIHVDIKVSDGTPLCYYSTFKNK
ncbi:hypothetical protein [Candidatus Mesenet endosymbiont of Phosphuga atrata]|uniref:hypothetical protein n=1 Tax=Candidatus Mesenet endosymbiont of Phosphuga atrata TaxID=3066221 RepID=UPI0030CEC3AD